MDLSYIINDEEIVIFIDKEYRLYKSENEKLYNKVLKKIKNGIEGEELKLYLDKKIASSTIFLNKNLNELQLNENISYKEGVVFYKEFPIHNSLTKKIIQMIEEDYKDLTPMVNFLNNLMENPSNRAITELYDFLVVSKLPITKDGYFIAYKKVREDFKDIHTGTIDNSVGQVVKMPRSLVDDNQHNTCSHGLHFCAKDYLKHFGSDSSNRVVLLKINPKNVVSIPTDYNNTKGRCCEYEVIDTYIDDTLLENKCVYDECEEEYEYDEEYQCEECGKTFSNDIDAANCCY